MPNLHPNSTNYVHSYEPNTNNLTMAMDYDASAVDAAVRSAINTGYGSTNSDTWTLSRVSHIFIGEKI
jgi:hypothetical protein